MDPNATPLRSGPAAPTRLTAGQHALLLALVAFVQLASNGLFPGLGLVFLALLGTPWFRRRPDRVVLVLGAALSLAPVVVMLVDLVSGVQVGVEFGPSPR